MAIITIDTSKPIYVSLFKNEKRTDENNQPVLNVIIQQDKIDLLKGGVWAKEAASGLKYWNGTLEQPYNPNAAAPAKRAASEPVDQDIPF